MDQNQECYCGLRARAEIVDQLCVGNRREANHSARPWARPRLDQLQGFSKRTAICHVLALFPFGLLWSRFQKWNLFSSRPFGVFPVARQPDV